MAVFDHALLIAQLQRRWRFGDWLAAAWSAERDALRVLMVERHAYLRACREQPELWSSGRFRDGRDFRHLQRRFGDDAAIVQVVLVGRLDASLIERMEDIVGRFSIALHRRRAVALVDLVGFSKLEPMVQLVRLAGLEQALCRAEMALGQSGLRFVPTRTTTGDGFYLWDDVGCESEEAILLALVLLTFAFFDDGGRRDGYRASDLKACLGIGACFNLHRVEQMEPQRDTFIVGAVTIELARLMQACRPGRIFLGLGHHERWLSTWVDAVARGNRHLTAAARFAGRTTQGEISSAGDGSEDRRPTEYEIRAKHGMCYTALNVEGQVRTPDGVITCRFGRETTSDQYAA